MSTYLQDPHRLDTNVTIIVPSRVEVAYKYPTGWFINIDGNFVGETVSGGFDYLGDKNSDQFEITYFDDVGDAVDWLIERDLIKTKAYAELDKRVKKASKKKAKVA
jgi:hypothetical protein